MRDARRCLTLSVITLATGVTVAGCSSFGEQLSWNAKRALSNPGYADTTEMADKTWMSEAGETGRKGRTVEMSNDPLNLREIFMSEKARSIERNVGIE